PIPRALRPGLSNVIPVGVNQPLRQSWACSAKMSLFGGGGYMLAKIVIFGKVGHLRRRWLCSAWAVTCWQRSSSSAKLGIFGEDGQISLTILGVKWPPSMKAAARCNWRRTPAARRSDAVALTLRPEQPGQDAF